MWLQKVLSSGWLDSFFYFITDLHKQIWFQLGIILPLLGFWIFFERMVALRRFFSLLLTMAIVDGFCGQIIKKAFARPRPFALFPEIIQKSPASGFGFVSNHTANMVCLAVFLSHFYPRWRLIWWTLAILISFSRIYNGVHFVSDVLVGGLIGALFGSFSIRLLSYLKSKGRTPQ